MKYDATRIDRHIIDLEEVNKFCKRVAELEDQMHKEMWEPPATAESANAVIQKFNREIVSEAIGLALALGYIGTVEVLG